jgi:hypothetical protein
MTMHATTEHAKPQPAPTQVLTDAQVRRLAEVLAHAFHLTEGAALVWVLGSGQERDNREALAHWVRGQVSALDAEVAGALLPVLIKRLERTLKDWEDAL